MNTRAALLLCVPAILGAQSVVHVTSTNYAFDAPDTVVAGLVTFQLVNKGPELHHLQVVRFEHGKTMADFAEAMKTPGPPPAWVTWLGGPNATVPDGATISTDALQLTPGSYAYLCLMPSPDMTPHIMKGMVRPFTVVPATAGVVQASAPHVDATLSLFDYNFTLDKPLAAGRRTILVTNTGPQFHEAFIAKLLPGTKADSLPAWLNGGMKGAPPVIPIGGVTGISANGRNYLTVDLTPGDYAFYCFFPDMKDGKEHVVHGMIKPFHVE